MNNHKTKTHVQPTPLAGWERKAVVWGPWVLGVLSLASLAGMALMSWEYL